MAQFEPGIVLQATANQPTFDPIRNYMVLAQLRAAKQQEQMNQFKLAQMQQQQQMEGKFQNAAQAAVIPQQGNYQEPAMNLGGNELPARQMSVQGPPQFNQNAYASNVEKFDPLAANQLRIQQSQAQQGQQEQSLKMQQQVASLKTTQLAQAEKELELNGRDWFTLSQMPPEAQAAMYPQVVQTQIKRGSLHPEQVGTEIPAQYPGPDGVSALVNRGQNLAQLVSQESAKRKESQAESDKNAALSARTTEVGNNIMQYNPKTLKYDQVVGPAPVKAPPAGSTTGNDIKDTAQAIQDGQASPVLTDYSFRDRTALAAELKRKGFNQAQAALDWKGTQRYMSTLNGPQQVRLRQSIEAAGEMVDKVDGLYQEWKQVAPTSGIKILNRATLATAKNLPGRAGAVAQALQAQIADLNADLGNIYMGGNSPTDHALALAKQSLSADWNEETFQEAVKQIKANVKIRSNSVRLGAPAGVSDGSPYNKPGPQGTPQAQPQGGGIQVTDPQGGVHMFPNQQAADQFKKAAGIQ